MIDSRAVIIRVNDTDMDCCAGCSEKITSDGNDKKWIVANVYEGSKRKRRWDRLEHWHISCYDAAGSPYGTAEVKKSTAQNPRAVVEPEEWEDDDE